MKKAVSNTVTKAASTIQTAATKAYGNYVKPTVEKAKSSTKAATNWLQDTAKSLGTATVNYVNRGQAYVNNMLVTATSEAERLYCSASQHIRTEWEEVKVDFEDFKDKAADSLTQAKNKVAETIHNIDWARIGEGTIKVLGAAAILVVCVGAVATTGGAILPALTSIAGGTISGSSVMVLGTFTAGTAGVMMGSSDLLEGGQDVVYGLSGNEEAASWNVLRDNFFTNNPEDYYMLESAVSYGAGVGLQMVNIFNSAEQVKLEAQMAGGNKETQVQVPVGGSDVLDDVVEGTLKSEGKTISYTDYNKIYQKSIYNAGKEKVMLGKYDGGGSTSYITKAGDDYTYFNLGSEWEDIKTQYGYTDNDMFKLFNEAFLDDGINAGKVFQFSHNPVNDQGALGQEYQYLLKNDYIWDGTTMTMSPKY